MHTVNIHEAKTTLSKLIDEALQGEEVIIARAGTPVIKLVPVEKKSKPIPGLLKGEIWIADDFDAPLPDDILNAFEGK